MLAVSHPFGGVRCQKWVTINNLRGNASGQASMHIRAIDVESSRSTSTHVAAPSDRERAAEPLEASRVVLPRPMIVNPRLRSGRVGYRTERFCRLDAWLSRR
jgi:hypothetical protein